MLSTYLNAVALLSGLAVNADSGPLQWKFKQDETFYLKTVSTIKQTTTYMGRKIEQKLDNTTIVRFKVLKKDANGVTLEQTLLQMVSKGDLGGGVDLADKVKGATFTVKLNTKGQVTQFDGYKKFIEKAADGNDTTRQLLMAMLPEDAFKQMFEEIFTLLPGKAVTENETWQRKLKAVLGPVGEVTTENKFTYAGKVKEGNKDLEKITHTATLKYAPPSNNAPLAGLPFKVTSGTMKADKYDGTILFDPAAGRVHSSKVSMKFDIKLKIASGNQSVDVTLDQDSTTTSTVLDKSPLGD